MVRDTSTLHTVKVDCSYRQLSNLPENLPENTVLLNVTNNNVMYINYFYKKLCCFFFKVFIHIWM